MDDFLTEEDYLPDEFGELPLDEAILRVRELEDEEEDEGPSTYKQSKEKKRKRHSDDDDDEDKERSDGPDDQLSDDDGWLVNDLGDEYDDEKDEDENNLFSVKDGVKTFGEDEAEEEEDGGDGKRGKKKKKAGDKDRRKRRDAGEPKLSLDCIKLMDIETGLPALLEIQKKLHLKGDGHEEEDLDMIIHVVEQWAHQLMPKLRFNDVIKRCRKLMRKRVMKALIKDIRHDNPLNVPKSALEVAEMMDGESDRSDNEESFNFDDDLPPMPTLNAEDAFDALMREAEEVVKQKAAAAATSTVNSPSVSGLQSTVTNQSLDKTVTPMKVNTQPSSSQSIAPVIPKPTSSKLTEEQRKKIAENARKAAEKRLSLSMARSQQIPVSQPIPNTQSETP